MQLFLTTTPSIDKLTIVFFQGKCKCIRRQLVADIKGDTKFSEVKGIDKLGYVKQPSHADGKYTHLPSKLYSQ